MAGQMVHLEIPAGDTAKAREFWGSLFGWKFEEYPGPTEYHMTRFSETTGGAINVIMAKPGNELHLIARENLAGGIIRITNNDRLSV